MANLLCCFWLLAFVADPPAPPGTARIGDNLFMDKQPVAVVDYREFLVDVELNGYENLQVKELLPDSLPALEEQREQQPITGLTDQQIGWYCGWRGKVVSQMKNDPGIRCSNDRLWRKMDRYDPGHHLKIRYRLPYKKEYPARFQRGKLVERTADGFTAQPESSVYGFRCVAEFVPIE